MDGKTAIADLALEEFESRNGDAALLFKYQTINDYSIDALKNGYLLLLVLGAAQRSV